MPDFGPVGSLIVAGLGGYLAGSIPFGLVLTKLAGLGDIRAIGSGNIGATNVLRTGQKGLAAATLLLDGGKGAVAALVCARIGGADAGMIAGLAAVVGHNFPVWLNFKGGKGVATSLGVLIAVAWPVGLLAGVTWLATASAFRYSSLAALVAFAVSPLYAWHLVGANVALLAAALAVLTIVRHHANIRRLLKGKEPKIGAKKSEPGQA